MHNVWELWVVVFHGEINIVNTARVEPSQVYHDVITYCIDCLAHVDRLWEIDVVQPFADLESRRE